MIGLIKEDAPVAQSSDTLDALFVNLVMIFKTAAFQQLGKTLNPMTGKVEKNLEQARFSIDMIEMLKEKTRGNLSEDLDKLVDSTLLELRMNYVEEADSKAAADDSKAEADEAGPADSAGSEADEAASGTGTGEAPGEPGSDSRESTPGKPQEADSDGAGSPDEQEGRQGD